MGGHFSEKKRRLRQRSQPLRASKKMGAIFLKKKRLRQRTHKLGDCRNMRSIFLKKRRLRQRSQPLMASKKWGPFFRKKRSACGNVVSRSGLPEIPGAVFEGHFFPCQIFPCPKMVPGTGGNPCTRTNETWPYGCVSSCDTTLL